MALRPQISGPRVSRRTLLGGAAALTIPSLDTAKGEESAPAGDHMSIKLRVNGAEHAIAIEPQATLAEVLRGPLGLTGTKISCNRGACSACTVWLDGLAVPSCSMLAIEVGSREVTTIEGLAKGEELHPVQEAFIEHDAMQCGFCTPGMAMAAAALLAHNPYPQAADVERAISGHICRCGTYPHVVAATLAAARARKG